MISARALRKARPDRTQKAHIPPPVGGLNTVDPGYDMPDGDCPLLYNWLGGDNGLHPRQGYKEWCLAVGATSVPTIMPFFGSGANGSKDRLFATSTGTAKIYSVGASSSTPSSVLNFASSAGDAGWGIAHGMVSGSGQHFLLYCDEQNGYHVYSETNDSWVVPVQQATVAWTKNTAVTINVTFVLNKGITYKCSQSGTTENTDGAGPIGVGIGIVDGTAKWDYAPSIGGVDPAKFVFATVWKNFVLFVEKDTSRMWFSATTNALYGTVTSWDFGSKFRHGGNLVGLWSWTVDGGIGIDDYLVAVSSSGDVVIYSGTDPNSVNTFAVRGVWFVGGVPAGRRIATDFGGDLLLLSSVGVIPLSKLVSGVDVTETSQQYATQKVGNLFNQLVTTYGSLKGWSLRIHPGDNALVVTIPLADGQATVQLAMSLLTRGWSQYRDLPIVASGVWGRKLYFGTADGRVCVQQDYLDNVKIDGSTFTPIQCSGITAFRQMGGGRQVQIQIIRPSLLSEGGNVTQSAQARYNFDLSEIATVAATPSNASNLWDSMIWDSFRWGGGLAPQKPVAGGAGMGSDAAIAFRVAVNSHTILLGFDVAFTVGGML